MRSFVTKADPAGRLRIEEACVGFCLTPALPAVGRDVADRPGSFPVRVKAYPSSELLDVVSGDSHHFGEPITGFEVQGAEGGSSWLVTLFQSRGEGLFRSPLRRDVWRLQAPAALPVAAPVGDVGIQVRPGWKALQLLLRGVAQDVHEWVRTVGGTWQRVATIAAGEWANGGYYAARLVDVGGGRLYWQAAAAGPTLELDVESEVG